jgi:mono/diheme cytochrome c family protein
MTATSKTLRARALPALALTALALAACRGGVSKSPPVHLVLDMDFQPKLRAQDASDFWADGMAMRHRPAGTVARGSLGDDQLARYGDPKATPPVWATESPIVPTAAVYARGRERYDIHCAPCHDRTGSGQGLVGKRWPVPVASFYTDDRADLPLGRIVSAITNGFGTMPSYAHQVSWEDRWAIAHYVRALQFRMKAPKN